MKKITPFLWFDNNAEEAMNFYISIFKNSKLIDANRQGDDGLLTSARFELEGQELMVLNAGPYFKFTEAISLFVDCKDQKEVDELWEKLSEGGQKSQCGWLKDKFGLSWQIIPKDLGELLSDSDPEKSERVMQAMLKMTKIDIEGLRQAYEGE
ncbi:MAG: VOC family protein [Patescibacteria group bacterium]